MRLVAKIYDGASDEFPEMRYSTWLMMEPGTKNHEPRQIRIIRLSRK
jgi:hypothetical protein